MTLKNDRLLRALRRQEVDCTPVWIMRQAGRYLPEYRATRARAGDFLRLCKTPELACEVTLQPLQRFPLDAAILFSDILTIPDAMGLGLTMDEGVGPRFRKPLRSNREIESLPRLDIASDLAYVMQAVRLVRRELDGSVPLIGFSGSPWTLAAYMVEGESSRQFRLAKGLLHDQPQSAHRLLGKLTLAVTDYLKAQAEAGAQALMIFDTWGGVLATSDYIEFSLNYLGSGGRVAENRRRHPRNPRDAVHQRRRQLAGINRRYRLRCGRARLDRAVGRCTPANRRARRVAGQPRPRRVIRLAAKNRNRSRPGDRAIRPGPGAYF